MRKSILLLIDELGPGGAQRQICMLAVALAKKGYAVEVVCYHNHMWFKQYLLDNDISVRLIEWRNQVNKLWRVWVFLRKRKNDAVISFLRGAGMLNILAGFPWKRAKIIVSERTASVFPLSLRDKIYFFLFNFADCIIVNSKSQMKLLIGKFPYLSHKIKLILNGVDLNLFHPFDTLKKPDTDCIVFGTFGSYTKMKCLVDLILAVDSISERLNDKKMTRFIWFGEHKNPLSGENYAEYEMGLRMISAKGLTRFFDLRGPTTTPEEELQKIDCLCLVSDQEGFPNSICEAFACGKPVVATRVGDIPYLVVEGKTGFLADPKSPKSIASALLKMISLDSGERVFMGKTARTYAEQNLSIERCVNQYVDVINE